MKRLVFLILVLLSINYAHSQCTLSNGASVSTIQNAENSAASGSCGGSGNNAFGIPNNSTVNWAAGNYSITSVINIGNGTCNIGPTISPWTTSTQPTAKLTGGPIAGAQGFSYNSGSTPGCFAYLSWNGNLSGNANEDGGGWIDVGANTSNLTIEYNQAYGINGTINSGNLNDTIIYLEGSTGSSESDPSTTDTNISILWNHFGIQGSNDCGPIMNQYTYQGGTYDSVGGQCAAIGTYGNQTNMTIAYNIITQMEQGLKFYEPGCSFPNCFDYNSYSLSNVNVYNNDISFIHRIGMEGQQTPAGGGENVYNNDFHDGVYTSYGSWQFSLAQCCSSFTAPMNFTGNVLGGANSTSGTNGGPGLEFWSIGNANNNLEQGYAPLQYGCGENPWSMNYNVTAVYQSTSGGINDEGCGGSGNIPLYQQIGNVDQGWPPVALISTAPTISPSSGSFSGAHTVTFTDAGDTSGTGPQGNHSIWYTVDGSTATPGSGSAVCIASGGTASIVATTVHAVGMWGSCNQPTSYAAGYGFVPSGSVTATFSSSGSSPTASPTYNPGTENFITSVSPVVSSTTSGAVISCTVNGTAIANANSPATLGPFTANTVLVCTATATGFTTSPSTTVTYTLSSTQQQAASPVYNPGSETFSTSVSPSVSSSTPSAVLNCTANGSTLATQSSPFTYGPFTGNTTLVCYATASGYTQSANSTATYTLNSSTPTAATPTFNPGSETFTTSVSPVVSSSTPNATITCNGNSATSPATFGPYTTSTTLSCYATAAGYTQSATASAAYTLQSSIPPGAILLSPSMSTSQLQTTINTAQSGGTVEFQAGTYSLGTSTLTIPCGVTATGPITSPAFTLGSFTSPTNTTPIQAYTPTQPTAILSGTPGSDGNSLLAVNGCGSGGTTTTIQYLWGQNVGLLSIGSNTNNVSVLNNWCTNIVPTGLNNGGQEDCVDIGGYQTSASSNILIQWNQLGDANSCAAIFADFNYDNGNNPDQGGYCSGIQDTAGVTTNLTIENNLFYHLEEHLHLNQLGSTTSYPVTTCDNCIIRFNWSYQWQRIDMEIQPSVDAGAQSMQISDNVISFPPNPIGSSMGLSLACCVSNSSYSGPGAVPADLINDNLFVQNSQYIPPIGIEWWGVGSQLTNNNQMGAFDSYVAVGTGSFGTNYGSPIWGVSGNYMCGGNTTIGFIEFSNEEDDITSQANTPTNLTFEGAGNDPGYTAAAATYAQNCQQLVSSAPTISPNGGSYSGSQVVTLPNSGLNVTTYYTTDGSTPVPGQGTTQIYNGAFTISSNGTTTVEAVGMWGQIPQPINYPAPYGWVPSATVIANFTNTGGTGIAAPVFTPGSENFTGSVSPVVTTTTPGASIICTANNVPITGSLSPKTLGPFTITTAVSCEATLNGASSAATLAAYTLSSSLTLTSITTGLSGSSSLNIGGTVQGTATCYFSNGTSASCGATYPVTWTSTSPGVATVSSTGLVTGVATGSSGIYATAGGVVGSTVALTVGQTVPPPTMSPTPPYTFSPTVQVTLSDSLSGAAIYYCITAGCVPSNTSTLYAGAITLSNTTTINAIGILSGYANSAVASGTYTLGGAAPTLQSVATSLAGGSTTVALGGTVQAIATCTLSNGTSASCSSLGYTVSSWNTSAPAIASISSTGLVTGISLGSATVWAVAGGITGSTASVTVVNVTLTALNIATTGGLTTFNIGATNNILATCVYSNGSFDLCNTPDSSGNSVTAFTSTNAGVASVTNGGVMSALSPGTTAIGAYIGGSSVTNSQLGVINEDLDGVQFTYSGSINSQYMVTGSAAGGYVVNSCSFYLPAGTQASGAFWDCVLNQATSSTTQAAAALCSARYTTSGTSTPAGWVTINMTGCPTLAANQGYFLGLTTNQGGPVDQGGYDCGSSCTGSAPTSGVGTYPYFFLEGITFGSYGALSTTFTGQTTVQSSQYLNLTNTTSAVINATPLTITVLGANGVTTLQGITIRGVQIP